MIVYRNDKLKKIGNAIVTLIKERTAEGRDKDDKPFKAYSRKPFALPYGAVNNHTKLKRLIKSKQAIVYSRPNGMPFVLIKMGYAEYKKTMFDPSGRVNLMASGRMLADLSVLDVGNNRITIGFRNREMAARAVFNANRGREFLGVTLRSLENDAIISRLLHDSGGLDCV